MMALWKVTLRMTENGKLLDDMTVDILTIAETAQEAAGYVQPEVEKSDGPMTPGFHWVVIGVSMIAGKLAIPAMKKITPVIREEDR